MSRNVYYCWLKNQEPGQYKRYDFCEYPAKFGLGAPQDKSTMNSYRKMFKNINYALKKDTPSWVLNMVQ